MQSTFSRLFTEHPSDVGETYFQHLSVAMWFAGQFALAMGAAFVHALVPGLCKKTGSNIVMNLHAKMGPRR